MQICGIAAIAPAALIKTEKNRHIVGRDLILKFNELSTSAKIAADSLTDLRKQYEFTIYYNTILGPIYGLISNITA